MPTIKELQAKVEAANKLLAGKLPPGHRLRVAQLRLLDQQKIALRKKDPELDKPDEPPAKA